MLRIALRRRSRIGHRNSRTRRIPPHRADESDGDSVRNRTIRTEAYGPDRPRQSQTPLLLRESAGSTPAPGTLAILDEWYGIEPAAVATHNRSDITLRPPSRGYSVVRSGRNTGSRRDAVAPRLNEESPMTNHPASVLGGASPTAEATQAIDDESSPKAEPVEAVDRDRPGNVAATLFEVGGRSPIR